MTSLNKQLINHNVDNLEISTDFNKKNYISESKKVKSFLAEPLSQKPLRHIPGIGPVGEENLKKQDIIYCYQLVGLFLFLNNEEKFLKFLLENGIQENYSKVVVENIKSWCMTFIN